MKDFATTLESAQKVDRRTFFRRFAQVAGITAVAAGIVTATPDKADAFFSFGPKVNPKWKGLVAQLKEYVTRAYVNYDSEKAKLALESMKGYGFAESDIMPLQNVNRGLISKGFFLTHFYLESAASIPAIKLFTIAKRDFFDSFTVNGKKRTTILGRKMVGFDRVLLGDEVFSTRDVPPVALPYNLAPAGSEKPEWVIAVPYGWIHDLYGRRAAGIEERLVEELTIHEITHIMYQTRDELLPFLAQFGYRIDDDRPVQDVGDEISYLREKSLTYHQAERLIMERVYDADTYYGSSGNSSHLGALKQIKDDLVKLSEQVNKLDSRYPKNLLRISDQQCYASMALLYDRAARQFATAGSQPASSLL